MHNYRAEFAAMLRIAIPLALAELGWMAMGVVDTIMVGHLPDSAVSIGVASVGNALFYGFTTFGMGLLAGLDTLVSHAFGANDWPRARRALASALGLGIIAAPVVIAAILAGAGLLSLIGVREPVLSQAVLYTRIAVIGLPPLFLYGVLRRYLQALHHVRPITLALISANLVNVAGNWLLIFGHWGFPRLGVQGSAVSTVLARVYLAVVLYAAVKARDPAAFVHVRELFRGLRRLLGLGLPAALATGLEFGVFYLSTAVAGTLDAVSLAAHTIALNVDAVAYMIPVGISSAAAVSVGRAVGAGDRAGARRAAWMAIGLGIFFAALTALCCLVFPRPISRVYTLDARTISLSVTLFAIAAVFQMFDSVQAIATGALRGLGDTRTPLVSNLVAYWILGLPLGIWLAFVRNWGIVGVWYGLCAGIVLSCLGLLIKWIYASE